MTEPLTPPNCDIRNFPRMMLDIVRLKGSTFNGTSNHLAWRAGLNLWMAAWHQVPAASLEDSDDELAQAAGFGWDVKAWQRVRTAALRGFVKCEDGRLYHETLAEFAIEAWIEKLGHLLSSNAGNAKRHKLQFDPGPIYDDIKAAADALRRLNPRSKALSKKLVENAEKGLPMGFPAGGDAFPPGYPEGLPSASQGNGIERKVGEASLKASPTRRRVTSGARAESAPPPRAAWQGPVAIREAVAARMGEDWTASWLDPCEWDEEGQTILAPKPLTVTRLEENVRRELVAARVLQVRVKGRAA